MSEAMNLTEMEAILLAERIVGRLAVNCEDWLECEDYPNIGEHAWERLVGEVQSLGYALVRKCRDAEMLRAVDTLALLDEAVR